MCDSPVVRHKGTKTPCVYYSPVVGHNGQTCVIPSNTMGQNGQQVVCDSPVVVQNGQTRCVRFPSRGTKRTNTLYVCYFPVVRQKGQKRLCLVFQVRPMYLPTSEAFHIGSSKQSGQNFKGYIKVCMYIYILSVCYALITAAKINPFSAAGGLCTVSSGSS